MIPHKAVHFHIGCNQTNLFATIINSCRSRNTRDSQCLFQNIQRLCNSSITHSQS